MEVLKCILTKTRNKRDAMAWLKAGVWIVEGIRRGIDK
jgi:hypothetical protein